MKILRVTFVSVLAALGVGIASTLWFISDFLESPVDVPLDGVRFDIPAGANFGDISRRLHTAGIIRWPRLFRTYARVTGRAGSAQAGEYLIESGTSPEQLLELFVRGEVLLYSFTIVEGWNNRDLLSALHAHPNIRATLYDDDWSAFLAELGAPTSHPEGLFLPETYRFPKGLRDRDLLRQAYMLMQETLHEEWAARSGNLPIKTPYEALILASIVEKETARADERARIAGVFVRRLEKRMRLQTDPTVIYGIGPDFDGNLTRRDLQSDTPYNTYTRHGLPPTPIAMPGRAAIHAVLHPADGNALYFVATGDADGSHRFSATRQEHDAAVAEYLARLRQRRRSND